MNTAMSMTEGPIIRPMLRFMLPLLLGNLFQQLYNTADALIVGRLLGEQALAAVSSTGSMIFLLVSLFAGISAGAGVAIARYFGAKEPEKLQKAIHTNVAFGLVVSVILTVLGTLATPAILRWMDTPADVMAPAVEYVQIYFAGSFGMVMYNCLRSIMQALGNSRDPLFYLMVSSVTNVVLDIVFISVFHGGVGSAALATVISQFLSAWLCLRKLRRVEPEYRVYLKKIRFHWDMLKLIIAYGLPSGLQNSVIAIANVVVQSNVNAFGTMAAAGCGAYSKVEGFVFMPVDSLNMTLSTYVSQNLGARKQERVRKGCRFGILCAMVLAQLVGLVVFLAAPTLLGIFTDEPEAIAYGIQKARICTPFYLLLAASHALASIYRGAGKAVVPMGAMLGFWCVLRVSILKIFVPVFQSIAVVNWVYPITWACTTVFFTIYYYRANWMYAFEKRERGE